MTPQERVPCVQHECLSVATLMDALDGAIRLLSNAIVLHTSNILGSLTIFRQVSI